MIFFPSKILSYICETKRFAETSGVKLWKLLEENDVVNGRTWASMKERFRKVGANVRNIAYTLLLLYTTTYLEFFDYEISEEKNQ